MEKTKRRKFRMENFWGKFATFIRIYLSTGLCFITFTWGRQVWLQTFSSLPSSQSAWLSQTQLRGIQEPAMVNWYNSVLNTIMYFAQISLHSWPVCQLVNIGYRVQLNFITSRHYWQYCLSSSLPQQWYNKIIFSRGCLGLIYWAIILVCITPNKSNNSLGMDLGISDRWLGLLAGQSH